MGGTSEVNDADEATVRRIVLAWRELRRGASGAVLRAHLLGPDGPPLEQAQLDALEILVATPDGADGWRMSDFADALRVDPSTATRAIARLERHGLAERTKADDDRRIVIARATTTGKRMVRRVGTNRATGMQRLLEPFDDAARIRFADDLERFVSSIDDLVAELIREDQRSRDT
ncbi:MAG: MarR family transcriptional regulator [Ilumatobacteraceae bacterium]